MTSIPKIDYAKIMGSALRDVVRQVMLGLPRTGDETCPRIYLSVRTDHSCVVLPQNLILAHREVTLLFQNGYDDLKISDEGIECNLTFGDKLIPVYLPLKAISSISDPASGFRIELVAEDTHPKAIS